jgi:hypothetical protein
MSLARVIAAGLVAGGIAAGTTMGKPPAAVSGQTDGYTVLAADLHVHSFFGDGVLAPWEIVREARFRGLDVIAITNHNQLLGARIGAWSARGHDRPLVLVGEEVTAPRFHMTAVGVSRSADWHWSREEAIASVHAQGGVAIAAHPDKRSWGAADQAALRAIDGFEIGGPFPEEGNPWDGGWAREFFHAVAGINGNLAPIGATDFHFVRSLGLCRTYILSIGFSQPAVLDAIRQARTVSRDGDGLFYGDPALVRIVEKHLARLPGEPRAARWRSLAAVAALAGLAVLVLVR